MDTSQMVNGAKPIDEMPFVIYMRLHVQKTSGFKPVLLCLNDWPTISEEFGITTLTEKRGMWSIFVQESHAEIQTAVFALQSRVSIGSA